MVFNGKLWNAHSFNFDTSQYFDQDGSNYKGLPSSTTTTVRFTVYEPQNLLIDFSELNNIRQSTNFEALKS